MNSKSIVLWLAVAALAVAVTAASNPQCARNTAPTSPDQALTPLDQDPCKTACLDAFKSAKRDEQMRYKAAKEACNDDYDCRYQEQLIHEMIVDELVADKAACFYDCQLHQQGTGTGGQ